MIRRLAFILVFVLLVLVASCGGGEAPPPRPPVPTNSADDIDPRNVRNLCEFFHFRPHEVLITPTAQANASVYAGRPGVPRKLQQTVQAYYDAVGPNTQLPRDKALLDERYAAVINACQEAGWTP